MTIKIDRSEISVGMTVTSAPVTSAHDVVQKSLAQKFKRDCADAAAAAGDDTIDWQYVSRLASHSTPQGKALRKQFNS